MGVVMGAGGFLGGMASGYMVGKAMQGKKAEKVEGPKPQFTTPDMSAAPTDAQITANQSDMKDAYADGGMIGATRHPRDFGKRPCK